MGTDFGRDGHTGWNGQTQARHFRQICAFPTEEPIETGFSIGLSPAKRVDIAVAPWSFLLFLQPVLCFGIHALRLLLRLYDQDSSRHDGRGSNLASASSPITHSGRRQCKRPDQGQRPRATHLCAQERRVI